MADKERKLVADLMQNEDFNQSQFVRDGWCSPEFSQGCILRDEPKLDLN